MDAVCMKVRYTLSTMFYHRCGSMRTAFCLLFSRSQLQNLINRSQSHVPPAEYLQRYPGSRLDRPLIRLRVSGFALIFAFHGKRAHEGVSPVVESCVLLVEKCDDDEGLLISSVPWNSGKSDFLFLSFQVDYSGSYPIPSTHEIGRSFVDSVVNHNTMVVFHRTKQVWNSVSSLRIDLLPSGCARPLCGDRLSRASSFRLPRHPSFSEIVTKWEHHILASPRCCECELLLSFVCVLHL